MKEFGASDAVADPGAGTRVSGVDRAGIGVATGAGTRVGGDVGVGALLRDWRRRRRLSQLELSLEADVSARHLSFLETGRSHPSREMLLHLTELLDVPLRERNRMLLAAGFAPMFRERALNDPALAAARAAIELVLAGHEPYPAMAVDRHWTLVDANRALAPLLAGIDAALLQPPVNVLRLSLHPRGLAPRIVNLAHWRDHVLSRLRRQVEVSGDPVLAALFDELRAYPAPPAPQPAPPATTNGAGGGRPPLQHSAARDDDALASTDMVVPLQLRVGDDVLSLFGTITLFGTPVDVTLSELAIESFFPADAATAQALRRLAPT